mmetsp:Transcript_3764/g.6036  ORF Transcript_3764/g.6036 Transcript_3764/m.6036 type:complete len:91 (+) Transcript_3764:2119-2391(+)
MNPIMIAIILSGHCQELVCTRWTRLASSVHSSTMATTVAARELAVASMTSSDVAFRRKPPAIIADEMSLVVIKRVPFIVARSDYVCRDTA